MKKLVKFLDYLDDFETMPNGTCFIAKNLSDKKEFEVVFRIRYDNGKIIFLWFDEEKNRIFDYAVPESSGQIDGGMFCFIGPNHKDKLPYCSKDTIVIEVKRRTGINSGDPSYYDKCLELIAG